MYAEHFLLRKPDFYEEYTESNIIEMDSTLLEIIQGFQIIILDIVQQKPYSLN